LLQYLKEISNMIYMKSQPSQHKEIMKVDFDVMSISEDILINYYSKLINKMLDIPKHTDSYETSWNIEKGVLCRYKNSRGIFYLPIYLFQENWKESLIKKFRETFFKNKGIYILD